MAHVASIGAGMFSDLSVSTSLVPATKNQTSLDGVFATGTFERIENVREFPAMGTPPNIVNVPVYGSSTSQQIQGQADAPSMEITMNYVATDWADGTSLGSMVGDGSQRVFRFALLNTEPPGYESGGGVSGLAGDTSDGTATENSYYYWVGKVEALQVNPQLTDSNTATVTITVQSDFFGAFTVDPTA
jgi:hypothetical protein